MWDPTGPTYGDLFTAQTAVFSGWAFVGAIYAIFLQRKELSLQRRSSHLTRETVESQVDEARSLREYASTPIVHHTVGPLLLEFQFSSELVLTKCRVVFDANCDNPSQHPAINVQAWWRFSLPGDASRTEPIGHRFDERAVLMGGDVGGFAVDKAGHNLTPDDFTDLLGGILSKDANKGAFVVVEAVYRNAQGGRFHVTTRCRITASGDVARVASEMLGGSYDPAPDNFSLSRLTGPGRSILRRSPKTNPRGCSWPSSPRALTPRVASEIVGASDHRRRPSHPVAGVARSLPQGSSSQVTNPCRSSCSRC